jgi:peptide deformylase
MILQLLYYGNPKLRKKCQPIVQITEDLKQLAQDMIDTMLAHDAVGLAAPQIGRHERIFVTRSYNIHPDGKWSLNAPKIYINPKIVWYSKELDTNEEGCISVPGLAPKVTRPYRVRVEALDLDGLPFTEEWEFYNARMIMHENDHLNGVLNIDRIDNRTRKQIEPYLREIKKKYNPS